MFKFIIKKQGRNQNILNVKINQQWNLNSILANKLKIIKL